MEPLDPNLEIRKLSPGHINELIRILGNNKLQLEEPWKSLMAIIPKHLEYRNYNCDIRRDNLPKYHSEDFRLIENASKKYNKACIEILFDEWGTSGKIRPTLGHLLHLLVKAELFRAADYIAIELLKQRPPARPSKGPAALVPTNLEDVIPTKDPIEELLDEINYPSSAIEDIINTCNHPNQENKPVPRVVPEIVVIESPDEEIEELPLFIQPQVIHNETHGNSHNVVNQPQSANNPHEDEFYDSNNSIYLSKNQPQVSLLMGGTKSYVSGNIPILSALNQNSNCINSSSEIENTDSSIQASSALEEVKENSPVLFTSSTKSNISENIPNLSALNGSSSNSINSSSEIESTENCIPALSALKIESKVNLEENEADNVPAFSQILSNNAPHLSLLMNNSSSQIESDSNNPNLSALMQSNNCLENSSNDGIIVVPNISLLNNPSISIDNNSSSENSSLGSVSIKNHNDCPSPNIINSESTPNFDALIPNQYSRQSSSKNSRICVSPLPNLSLNTQLPHYTYCELERATNSFDETPYSPSENIGRFLGSGAFGSVFLALGLLDHPVAVKKLMLNDVNIVNVDDTVTKQFKNEVELLSKYHHENLLSLLGYSCDGATYCLLYEYVPGGSLKDRLQKTDEKLIWTERLYIALGTARAISYLHKGQTPLIHRDIKTANILLDLTNKPKLCDFGLIKLSPSQNTNTGTTIFGTSAYMAPEAFRGDISIKIDTFSFGVVLLELLTSLQPYDVNREGFDIVTHVDVICGDSIKELLDTKAGPWSTNNIDIGEEIYTLARKCLEQKSINRPTMLEVTEELDNLIKKSI